MKQHITEEQLNELDNNAKQKLREWWKPNVGDFYYLNKTVNVISNDFDAEYGMTEGNYKKGLPLLSIGQMIEFLYDKVGIGYKWDLWVEYVYESDMDHNLEEKYKGELCDALWEACKEVFKSNKEK